MAHSYLLGLLGGLTIGLAAAVYLLGRGKVMGASGIVGGLIDGSAQGAERWDRVVFVSGLVLAPLAAIMAFGLAPSTHLTGNPVVIVVAGLLVGFGARLANGCTSGHGVCGISRLSVRGIAATVVYVGVGGLTVLVFRNVLEAI